MPLEDLLVDREAQIESLVKSAKDLIGVDKVTGETVIHVSRAELSDRQLVGLHLVGRYFASELEKAESPRISLRELAEKTGLDCHSASARLSELKKEGFARSPSRGESEIVFPRMGMFLDQARSKLGL